MASEEKEKKDRHGRILLAAVIIIFTAAAALFIAAGVLYFRGRGGSSREASESSFATISEDTSISENPEESLAGDADLSDASEPEASSEPSGPLENLESSDTNLPESSQESAPGDDEIDEEERKEALVEKTLEQMTLEEKVGQMFLARYPGVETAAADAHKYHLGGYILFAVDFEGASAEEVRAKIDQSQAASSIPMLMAVDEEGGTVVRVSPYFRDTPFASPREVYEAGGWDGVAADTREKCQLLKSLHLNMNMAPVCDLAGNTEDFMYDRSFGSDAALTSQYVETVVSVMKEEGVASCLKHFPGYGNNADTHTGIAYDERSAKTFYSQDFLPFEAGIQAGAPAVMVCHNMVSAFDEGVPASLSANVHRIARQELGFDGVLVTDDLSMGAIVDYSGEVNAAVLAIEAGNDILISTEYADQYEAVMQALSDGTLTEERIDESVRRILRMKIDMGLISEED